MLIRFTAFHQSLTEGQFPVRFTKRLNNNYGYPVLNFLYPGPFYLAEIPKLIGFSFTNSIKTLFVLSTIGSSFLMFWALSTKFNNIASFTGSMVYLFTPYRFFDLYVRGSLGENVAFMAAPLVLGSIFMIAKGSNIFFPILALSIAFLIISHNVLAILFLIVSVITCVLLLSSKLLLKTLSCIMLGFLISAFFSVPALYDLQFVKLSEIKIADPVDYLIPFWNNITQSNENNFSPQLGLVAIIIFLTSILLLKIKKKGDSFIVFLVVTFLISTFLITTSSKLVWTLVPGIDLVQFPWRLLSITTLISALLAASAVDKIKIYWVGVAIVVASVGSTIIYIRPAEFTNLPDSYYSTNEDTTTVKDEYMPLWVQEKPRQRASTNLAENSSIEIISEQLHGLTYKSKIHSNTDTKLTYNTIYFPGFKAKVDSKQKEINYTNREGLISVGLPKGTHEVIIYFGKTTVHLVAELVSLLSLVFTSFLLIKIWKSKNFSNKAR